MRPVRLGRSLPLLLLGLACCTSGERATRPPAPASRPAPPVRVPDNGWPESKKAAHVLNRLAFGPAPQDLREVEQLGVAVWISRQLNPAAIEDGAVEERLAGYRTLGMSVEELERAYRRSWRGWT
jgi:hypothetical protein